MVDFGREVRLVLANRGATARELAAQSGLHETKVSRLLHGHVRLTPELQRKVVAALYPGAFEEAGRDEPAA